MTDIDLDSPLRLDVALKLAFPAGGMTVAGLRREISKGRLAVEVIAGKQFTTLNSIAEMRKKCRANQQEQDCGSDRPSKARTASSAKPHGLSATERASVARAALEKTARELKKSSPTTSPKSTVDQAASAMVIPLKST
jgi:hypothetical protein